MSSPKSSIILPLYIYPLPGAWDPLHEAISAHPHLNFVIILNPHNGPGESLLPDECYSREISRLNAHESVCTVGYVRVDYGKQPLTTVCEEIARYAGWSQDYASKGLGVHGIFFDETPNLYTPEIAAYLNAVSQNVKNTSGILGRRLVIHNPGTVPDAELTNPGPDVTAVVEESYARYRSRELQQRLSSLLRYDRPRCSYIVHSVPEDELKYVVQELRRKGEYVFVTSNTSDHYVKFGSSWGAFVEAMASDVIASAKVNQYEGPTVSEKGRPRMEKTLFKRLKALIRRY